MISRLTEELKCELCQGEIEFSASDTTDDYSIAMTANTLNVSDKIDDILLKYLVYRCSVCGHKHRYTYKDIEYINRKEITKKVLMLIVRGEIINSTAVTDKFFIYCGKCSGFDGQGSCPKSIFNKCEIKRFPSDEL